MIKIIGIAVIALLLAPITTTISTAQISEECEDKIIGSLKAQVAKIDKNKARNMAESDNRFKAITNLNKEFNVIFYTYAIDTNSCIGSLSNVNVHYIANKDTKPIKTITVVIDDKLSKVEDVIEGDIIYAGSETYSPNYAGYEFKGNSIATNPIYESKNMYKIPTVSKPTSPVYACRINMGYNPCMLSIWTGLSDGAGGGSKIAQGGTVGEVKYTSSTNCNIRYFGFLEFYPSPAIECTNNYDAGDYVSVRVTNFAKNGGSQVQYDILVHNYSTNIGCGTFAYYFNLPIPTYADFIYERPGYQSVYNYATLPAFATNTMNGWLYYNNSQKSIYTTYSNGWYIKDIMKNGYAQENISVSNVYSTGQFTVTYNHSNGT